MTPKEVDQLISKYLNGRATDAEVRMVESLYTNASAKKSKAPSLTVDQEIELENRLKERISNHTKRSAILHNQGVSSRRYYAIAASFFILIVAGIYLINTDNLFKQSERDVADNSYIKNESEASQTIALADGSFVTLGPKSSLHFIFDSIPNSRIIRLSGEAFFDVAPNKTKPFFVYTQTVVTKVLGTSFNVRAFEGDKEITVSVMEGRVSVSAENNLNKTNEVILLPHEEVVYDKSLKTVFKSTESPVVIDSMLNAVIPMKFKEESVAVILTELEKLYNVKIVYEAKAFANCRITTTFIDESLRDRLNIISAAIGSTYRVVGTYLIMENPTCAQPKSE